MKNTIATSLLFALVAIAASACNLDKFSTSSIEALVSVSEQTGGNTRLTTYEYTSQGEISRITQSLNGKTLWVTSEFSSMASVVRYRTTYNDDGSTTRHKLETVYSVNGTLRGESLKIYLMGEGGSESMPVETLDVVTDTSTSPHREMSYTHTVKGALVSRRSGYDYSLLPKVTYTEERAEETRAMTKYYTSGYYEYRLFARPASDPDAEEVLVEEQIGFSQTGKTESYTVIDYEGASPVTTKYTYTYKSITVSASGE